MIDYDLKIRAVKTTMALLRTCGPQDFNSIKRELLTQCIGATQENVHELWSKVLSYTTHKRFPMIEKEEFDDGSVYYGVAERMYDEQGNYKGDI